RDGAPDLRPVVDREPFRNVLRGRLAEAELEQVEVDDRGGHKDPGAVGLFAKSAHEQRRDDQCQYERDQRVGVVRQRVATKGGWQRRHAWIRVSVRDGLTMVYICGTCKT